MNTSTVFSSNADSRRLARALVIFLLVGLPTAGLLAWMFVNRDTAPPNLPPMPVIATIPDFSLTECRDRTISRADLLGHVWVANFVFTNCSGPCPTLTLRMRSVQEDLRTRDPGADVKLVTFTLDPEHDTPPILRAYADKHHAEANRWWFMTGADQEAMHKLVQEGFLQSVKKATANEPIIHSTYFVLVDRKGQVRAVFDGFSAESKPLILRDIDRLKNEAS